MFRFLACIALALSLVMSDGLIVFAHPGRTDAAGGHYCRTKCVEKWGYEYNEWHVHSPKVAKREAKRKGRGE